MQSVATDTPTSCSVANIYISEIVHNIITKYNKIVLYRRLINDVTGVWIGNSKHTSKHQDKPWTNFKKDFNTASTLV